MTALSAERGAGAGTAPALSFSGVTFGYREDAPPAVFELDLSLSPGELVAVVGGNGSGKSTLARLANGLLLPQEGTVTVGGLDTADHDNRWAVHARVGMLFQDPEDQIVGATVEDDVAFGPENLGMPRQEMRRRVPDALAVVGLTGEESTEPHLLSGGQKQRLALAGVLVLQPSVLVLDEPTSMLDPAGRAAVVEQVQGLTARGVAVLLITQHMDEALAADRLLALDGGRLVFAGEPAVFFRSGAGAALPLSDPPAFGLAAELQTLLGGRVLGDPLPLRSEEVVDALRALMEGGALAPAVPGSPGGCEGLPIATAAGSEGRGSARREEEGAAAVSADLPPAVVEFRDVAYVYNRGAPFARVALEAVDLSLREGAVTAVIGATASGKSTLLQLAAGLLRPTRGRVLFAGRERPDQGGVGMAFQRAEVQLFASTVEADVAFAPRLQGVEGPALAERVNWALEVVGLDPEGFSGRMPHSLSLGEQRRAALAGVLSLDPPLLVLDEPTSGLDPAGRRRLMEHLLAWARGWGGTPGAAVEGPSARETGKGARTHPRSRTGTRSGMRSLVFTTHDLDEVATWADQVVLLHQGRLLAVGPTHDVLGDPGCLAAAGLLPPLAAVVARQLSGGDLEGSAEPGRLPVDAKGLAAWLTERPDRTPDGGPT